MVAGVVAGLGNGLVIPLSVERVVGGGDMELAGIRAGVNETSIELGASIGVAFLGGVQRVVFARELPEDVPSESFIDAIDMVDDQQLVIDSFITSGRFALVVAAVVVLLAVPWAARSLADEP